MAEDRQLHQFDGIHYRFDWFLLSLPTVTRCFQLDQQTFLYKYILEPNGIHCNESNIKERGSHHSKGQLDRKSVV